MDKYWRDSFIEVSICIYRFFKEAVEEYRPRLPKYCKLNLYSIHANQPWKGMDDMKLLKSAGLYIRDYKNNIEGFTLAAILLLGKDEVIASVIPYFKTDAILRKINLDRYDDRDDIRTNLIQSYDRLMAFVSKHLRIPFTLNWSSYLASTTF